jgi:signal transduction histidine kinase
MAVVLAVAVGVATAALVFRAAQQDRAALFATFSEDHLSRLQLAVRETEAELADVGQHLKFAARLVRSDRPAAEQRRELEALLAVVRGYRMMAVYDGAGRQRVSAVDPLASPSWSPAPFESQLAEAARAAMDQRGIAMSPVLGKGASWHRAFAMPLVPDSADGAVVVLVDLGTLFDRLRLVEPAAGSKLLLLDPDGRQAPLTEAGPAAVTDSSLETRGFRELLRQMRAGHSGALTLPREDAARLGLADAIAVFAPIRGAIAGQWSVASISSNTALREQERGIVLRMGALGLAFVAALAALSAYLVRSARRAIAVQERLRSAEQLAHMSSQLLRAEKLATVGGLAAGIAHEIGTPLGVVRGRAELLVSKLGEGGPAESARVIVDEIDRISRVIRQLLDFSSTSPARAGPVEVEAVASNVAELLAFEAASRKVALSVEVAPRLPVVAANPDELKQVLVNLTLNALHACSPGGHVRLRASPGPPETGVVIAVEDDGSGIPEELRHRVFDPFFTTKKRGKGTGLGLTVAAQIVRNHGGEIDVDGRVGGGTRVTVLWPVANEREEVERGEREKRADPRRR